MRHESNEKRRYGVAETLRRYLPDMKHDPPWLVLAIRALADEPFPNQSCIAAELQAIDYKHLLGSKDDGSDSEANACIPESRTNPVSAFKVRP